MNERWRKAIETVLKKGFEFASWPLFLCTVVRIATDKELQEIKTVQTGRGYTKAYRYGDNIVVVPTGARAVLKVDGTKIVVSDIRGREGRQPQVDIDVDVDGAKRDVIQDQNKLTELTYFPGLFAIFSELTRQRQTMIKTILQANRGENSKQ